MNDVKKTEYKRTNKQGGKFLSVLCGVLGVIVLLSVVVTALPLTVPSIFGIKIFRAENDDMAPELPQNSAVFAEEAVPEDIAPGEVIAFSTGETVTFSRVLENRAAYGEYVTRRDAGADRDPDPVPYRMLVGRIRSHIPAIGALLPVYNGSIGRIYVFLFAASGLMLILLSARLRPQRVKKQPARNESSDAEEVGAPERSLGIRWWKILIASVLLVAFFSSLGVILYYNGRYSAGRSVYTDTAERYVKVKDTAESAAADTGENTEITLSETPPITVDFSALIEMNPDVVGWIYCPDTPINYPVLRGETNDTYLRSGPDGSYLLAGSIFVDSKNSGDFSDANTVIYGHNMKDDSMFSCIENWSDQRWYEDHPVIWLLTPERDYRIELFSGHITDARSDCYNTVIADRDGYISRALSQSDFHREAPVPEGNTVLLSTCANSSNQLRYVLHGTLVPLASE